MKLHAKKCRFFMKQVVWCGRQISGDGIAFDPRNLSGLLSMQPPTTSAELQQFVCAAGWMRECIPQFTTITAPLHQLLELIYKKAGGRTKRCVARFFRGHRMGRSGEGQFSRRQAGLDECMHPRTS